MPIVHPKGTIIVLLKLHTLLLPLQMTRSCNLSIFVLSGFLLVLHITLPLLGPRLYLLFCKLASQNRKTLEFENSKDATSQTALCGGGVYQVWAPGMDYLVLLGRVFVGESGANFRLKNSVRRFQRVILTNFQKSWQSKNMKKSGTIAPALQAIVFCVFSPRRIFCLFLGYNSQLFLSI